MNSQWTLGVVPTLHLAGGPAGKGHGISHSCLQRKRPVTMLTCKVTLPALYLFPLNLGQA